MGPIDGISTFGFDNYMTMVYIHEDKETMALYEIKQAEVVGKVRGYFQRLLDLILNE